MLTVFWNIKGIITNDFLEKGETINTVSNCQFLRQNSPYLLNNHHTTKHSNLTISSKEERGSKKTKNEFLRC